MEYFIVQRQRIAKLIRLRNLINTRLLEISIQTQQKDNNIDFANFITERVAAYFHISVDCLKHDTRRTIIVYKYFAMTLIKDFTNLSTSEIGELFERDHATTLHAVRVTDDLCSVHRKYCRQMDDLRKEITQLQLNADN